MKARVVIGANFGDEGKGLFTDYLCATQGADVVVRFNSGAQAGHTVVNGKERHVFKHIGSGTLAGVPTFLSQFFVCNPIAFFRELQELNELGVNPRVYAHPNCLITTFADMLINQHKETERGANRHGSCGYGFGETINRSELVHLKITLSDLWNGVDLDPRLDEICNKYAEFRIGKKIDEPAMVEAFKKGCEAFANYVQPLGIGQCKNPVFEGAQGLLLDQHNKEFFPHVTRSSTGMENVRILCGQGGFDEIETYYMSRTYLNRHGAGPLPRHDAKLQYEDHTNKDNEWQGAPRYAPLDYNALRERCRLDYGSEDYKLVLTHCDQKGLESGWEADYYAFGQTRDKITAGDERISLDQLTG